VIHIAKKIPRVSDTDMVIHDVSVITMCCSSTCSTPIVDNQCESNSCTDHLG